ncbi:RNI-like protein [Gigaspora margarita]|nr:RNI-like protein [Gigaspora margarita]
MSNLNAEHLTVLLKILVKNTTKINVLEIEEFDYIHEPRLLHALECFIKSQEQLRQFSLISESYATKFHGIISALECQNKSLQEVKIVSCVCNTEFKMLMNCKNLEILRIDDCKNVNVLRASLKTLELTNYSKFYASNIVQILKESGTLLQRLSLVIINGSIQEESLLLETLKSFCPNLTYLKLTNIEVSTQFFELIGNLQKLQFLTLHFFEILDDEPEILVMQFAKLLPLTLQYLDLRNSWFISYIDILLNNCHAPLKYLLIDHFDDEKISKSLTEFCIRKNTLNYMGLNRYSSYSSLDDNIKKELEEYVTMVPHERIIVKC